MVLQYKYLRSKSCIGITSSPQACYQGITVVDLEMFCKQIADWTVSTTKIYEKL